MVRFIIDKLKKIYNNIDIFTFQYGQIYYVDDSIEKSQFLCIYIPIWLDLLSAVQRAAKDYQAAFTFQYGQIYYLEIQIKTYTDFYHLHSNMVRFIIIFR